MPVFTRLKGSKLCKRPLAPLPFSKQIEVYDYHNKNHLRGKTCKKCNDGRNHFYKNKPTNPCGSVNMKRAIELKQKGSDFSFMFYLGRAIYSLPQVATGA